MTVYIRVRSCTVRDGSDSSYFNQMTTCTTGANTGFGGSADTRTYKAEELQTELMRGLRYGILVQPVPAKIEGSLVDIASILSRTALPLQDPSATTSMPEAWVRAFMLIRLNSLSTGVSGVQSSTLETLALLLEKDIVPLVPLRGSISASGDLSPLAYLGALMQGAPSVSVWMGSRAAGERRLESADKALAALSIKPIRLGAKEGLAIVNGTATSAEVGALAVHEAHCQAALSQILTAMSVEALRGTDESFDPFFGHFRPHPGQVDSARNIFAFLAGSKFVYRSDGTEESSLRQDRYSIRTASQWIGPVLEDLLLSHQQVMIEANSVTDDPLIDVTARRMLHGGNFQAKVITSAMEKTRQACQTIGRMLFVQCTELINPATNRGLPPNLVVDEPSESFLWKGIDIMVAALQSELGFLANPVGSHVQTAEMGNQALNSLALISARYTLDSLEVLTQLSAAHLFSLCQALDLRAMNERYLDALTQPFKDLLHDVFCNVITDKHHLDHLSEILWADFTRQFGETAGMDSSSRFRFVIHSLQANMLQNAPNSLELLQSLKTWTGKSSDFLKDSFVLNRKEYLLDPDAGPYLGVASRRIYQFVRKRLNVPFLQEANISTPEVDLAEATVETVHTEQRERTNAPSMGSYVTTIYESMRSGALYDVVVDCLNEV